MSIWKQIDKVTATSLAEQYAAQEDAHLAFLEAAKECVDAMDSLDRVNNSILSHS